MRYRAVCNDVLTQSRNLCWRITVCIICPSAGVVSHLNFEYIISADRNRLSEEDTMDSPRSSADARCNTYKQTDRWSRQPLSISCWIDQLLGYLSPQLPVHVWRLLSLVVQCRCSSVRVNERYRLFHWNLLKLTKEMPANRFIHIHLYLFVRILIFLF